MLVNFVTVINHLSADRTYQTQTTFALARKFLQIFIFFPTMAEKVRNPDCQKMRNHLICLHSQFLSHVDGHWLSILQTEFKEFLNKRVMLQSNSHFCMFKQPSVLHTGNINNLCIDFLELFTFLIKIHLFCSYITNMSVSDWNLNLCFLNCYLLLSFFTYFLHNFFCLWSLFYSLNFSLFGFSSLDLINCFSLIFQFFLIFFFLFN